MLLERAPDAFGRLDRPAAVEAQQRIELVAEVLDQQPEPAAALLAFALRLNGRRQLPRGLATQQIETRVVLDVGNDVQQGPTQRQVINRGLQPLC